MDWLVLIRILLLTIPLGVGFITAVLLSRVRFRQRSLLPRGRWRFLYQGIVTVFVSFGLILGAANLYVSIGFGPQHDIVRRVRTEHPIVALTFDDGPSSTYTPLLLDILKEYQVPAAFFVVGDHVQKHPDIVARIHEEGHELGNHTYYHSNIPTTGSTRLAAELLAVNLAVHDASGVYPQFLRPPRGMYDARLRQWAELMDMQIILWSISGQDWLETTTPQRIASRVLRLVRPGDIILFHDSGAILRSEGASRMNTVRALPLVIEGLLEQGYRIVSLAELLEYPAAPIPEAEEPQF